MKIDVKRFRVPKGAAVELRRWPTRIPPLYRGREDYAAALHAQVSELEAHHYVLIASERYAVLLIFEAMDAGGKDGTVEHVTAGINPQECRVTSFKPCHTHRQILFAYLGA